MSRTCLTLLLLGFVTVAAAAERIHSLSLELWSRPRQGDLLVTYPSLGAAVREWSEQAGATLEIRYPGGEEGSIWAEELSDWLVALGVPSRHISTVPGAGSPDQIEIVVLSGGAP